MAQKNIRVGDISKVSGDVNIAGGDIYKGFTDEQVSALLTQITSTFQPKPFDGRCPYKGLDVFEEEDADLFFGRETVVEDLVGRVEDLVGRVQESRAVFITGPSGSGKSSLVRAGLIPALKQGAIEKSDSWLYETINPGRDPVEALASAFSRLKSPELAKYFRENTHQPDVLHECAESVLSGRKDQWLVLFVDQFEEVFTQVGKKKTEPFLNLVTQATSAENGRIIMLFAMRSDFVSNCATYPELNAILNRQFIQVGAMRPNELVSAIAQPALRVSLRIDPDLVMQIINDMQGEPGALPLMQFALKDLFDSQNAKGGVIALTLNDYLGRGGIHKALERHADNAFSKLNKDEQELARAIFSRLIEIGRGTLDTRRTALINELIPESETAEKVKGTVKKLADARLITTDEQAGVDTVTISHEKLIDAWPWLKKLINENRDVIVLQNEIDDDAKEWNEHKRDSSYLYTGARLVNVREHMGSKKLSLNGLAQEFVQKGITRRQRGQMALIGGISVIFILLAFAVIVFNNQANANAELANEALARQLAAQAQSLVVSRNSKQLTADLLAIQSLKMFPSNEGAQILLNSDLAARLIVRITHDNWVRSVAFSPDGEYVVSIGDDYTAHVWETSTGQEVARMTHDGWVESVAFSPDGKFIVSGSRDGTALVWDVSTKSEIARMAHEDNVFSVAFSPDSKYVVSGSWDHTARVWETSTGQEVARMTHDTSVESVAFSPDGKYVVSGSWDHTARVWEASTGQEVARMTHDGPVYTVAISPDGKYVVSGSYDGTARVWEASTGQEVTRMIHEDYVFSVAFSPDGKYVVSGSYDGTARVWEASAGQEVTRMTHDDDVSSVAFSPNGKYVASGSYDGTARVWEASTGQEVTRMTHDWIVSSVAFSPDDKYVVSGSWDNTARVWEAIPEEKMGSMTHDAPVHSVAFSPNGKYVASGSEDNTARVWEIATGQEVARMTHDWIVSSVAFSPDDKYIVSGSWDYSARVWKVSTGEEVARMNYDSALNTVAFSSDGKYVASGDDNATVHVWEVATGEEIARMNHITSVESVAFNLDGNYLVSGSEDNTVRVWEVATGEEVAHMNHGNHVYSVAFSPDSRYVISGCWDNTARVWEVATGEEVARMTHDAPVHSVAFSPDGRYVVTGSEDNTARVWEAATGEEVASMTHDSTVISVAFSQDGRYVLTGGQDNTARVWRWHTEDLIANACSRMTRNLTRAEWKQYVGDVLTYQAVCENLPIESEPTVAP